MLLGNFLSKHKRKHYTNINFRFRPACAKREDRVANYNFVVEMVYKQIQSNNTGKPVSSFANGNICI